MLEAKYFDNQIITVQNLEFQRDSVDKNIVDNFLTFTNQTGGIVTGLNVYSGTGLTVNVSQGAAYTNSGQRMDAYSGISFVATSGMVWAQLVESDFNPDPASSYASFPAYGTAQSNVNPINGSGVNVSNFNTIVITQTSGAGVIPLARINADNTDIKSIDLVSPYRQNLKLVGILDMNTSTIDGAIISTGSIDSNRFAYPLHYDIALSGINIDNTVSGSGHIGTPSFPIGNISTKILNVSTISGMSPIVIKSDLSFDSSARISTQGASLLINPSGQDTYVGGGSNVITPGILYINNISAWNNPAISTNPIMNISSGVLKLILGGNGGSYGLNVNAEGLGHIFTSAVGNMDIGVGNKFSIVASGNATSIIKAKDLIVQGTNSIAISGNTTIKGNTTVVGNITISGNTVMNGNTTISGNTIIGGNVTIASGVQIGISQSGVTNIGDITHPLNAVYAKELHADNATKAWVSFSGSLISPTGFQRIYSSYNVAYVSGVAIGVYEVGFITPFSDTNYATFGNAQAAGVQQLTYLDITGKPISPSFHRCRVLAGNGGSVIGNQVIALASPYINLQYIGY